MSVRCKSCGLFFSSDLLALEIFLVNFLGGRSVAHALAKGVVEINRFFDRGALHAASQFGIMAAGLIDFQMEWFDGFLGERVNAAVLLREILGAAPVGSQ